MLDVLAADPAPGERHGPVIVRAGGTAVTAALAASAAGAAATVVGRIGRDPAAAAIRQALSDAGVEALFAVDDELPTGTYLELGETVVASRGANARLSPADIPSLDVDAVLVSGYVLAHSDSRSAGEHALALEVRWRAVTGVPFGGYEVPGAANVLFANEQEIDRFDREAFEIVVLTRGAEGAHVLREGKSEFLPPTNVRGTGAGDALAGAFLASLS